MKRMIVVAIVSALSSVAVSSAMNGIAQSTNNNPRCSTIRPGGQYWLEYKDGIGRTQTTKPARIIGGAKVCISNPAKEE
jgi:hypothetical protein